MTNSGEENMQNCLETTEPNLVEERNMLKKSYVKMKKNSILHNKQMDCLRIKYRSQLNRINDLLDQDKQYSLLEKEYSVLLKENEKLKEKLVEVEKNRERSLNLQRVSARRHKEVKEREHKVLVEKLQEGVKVMQYLCESVCKSRSESVQEYTDKIKKLKESERQLTIEVDMLKDLMGFTTPSEVPRLKKLEEELDELTKKVSLCINSGGITVTGNELLDIFIKIGKMIQEYN